MALDPRAVFAALANDTTRQVYAAHVLGRVTDLDLSPAKLRRAVESLTAAGLLDDRGTATGDVFRSMLRPAPQQTGPERFIADGRVTRIPRADAERRELFRRIIDRIIAPDETLDERTVSARIGALHDDVTSLRRDLVDAGFLVRTPTGSAYRRGAGDGAGR